MKVLKSIAIILGLWAASVSYAEVCEFDHAATVTEFYSAFKDLNADAMNELYASNAEFQDPMFGVLNAEKTAAMWQMLTASLQQSDTWDLEFKVIKSDCQTAVAQWVAKYNYSATGRSIENKVTSVFSFADGKIYRQVDSFNLSTWIKQAFEKKKAFFLNNPAGKYLLKKQAKKKLQTFMTEI